MLCNFNVIFTSSKDFVKQSLKFWWKSVQWENGRKDRRKNRHDEANRRFPQLCVDKSNVFHRLELAWLKEEEPTDFKYALEDEWRVAHSSNFFFPVTLQPDAGLSLRASQPHLDTPHSVGLLLTSGQPDEQTTTWRHTKLTRKKSHVPDGIRPRDPRNRASTGIDELVYITT